MRLTEGLSYASLFLTSEIIPELCLLNLLSALSKDSIFLLALVSSVEIASKFNLKEKSVKNKLRKNNVKVELIDGGISYYLRNRALVYFQEKPKKLNTKKTVDCSDTSKRYRLSVLSKDGKKFVVKYIALTKEGCWKRMQAWFEQGWDFCVRSYDAGESF